MLHFDMSPAKTLQIEYKDSGTTTHVEVAETKIYLCHNACERSINKGKAVCSGAAIRARRSKRTLGEHGLRHSVTIARAEQSLSTTRPSLVNPSTRQAHAMDCLSAPLTPRRPGRPPQEAEAIRRQGNDASNSARRRRGNERTTTLSSRILQRAWLRASAGSNGPSNLLEDAAGASFPMPSRFNNQKRTGHLALGAPQSYQGGAPCGGHKPPPRLWPVCWPEQGSPVAAAP